MWGIARDLIGSCLCTYVPPPPYIVRFIYCRSPSLQMRQKCSELEGSVGALRAQLEASESRAKEQAAEVTKLGGQVQRLQAANSSMNSELAAKTTECRDLLCVMTGKFNANPSP